MPREYKNRSSIHFAPPEFVSLLSRNRPQFSRAQIADLLLRLYTPLHVHYLGEAIGVAILLTLHFYAFTCVLQTDRRGGRRFERCLRMP